MTSLIDIQTILGEDLFNRAKAAYPDNLVEFINEINNQFFNCIPYDINQTTAEAKTFIIENAIAFRQRQYGQADITLEKDNYTAKNLITDTSLRAVDSFNHQLRYDVPLGRFVLRRIATRGYLPTRARYSTAKLLGMEVDDLYHEVFTATIGYFGKQLQLEKLEAASDV